MIEAKIRLSAEEMELVTNASWILTKNGILEKVKWMLEGLQEEMVEHLSATTGIPRPQDLYGTPKISKGENYQGLPYLILDYPRIFHRDNRSAIRTMFWWGNFFSSTLHLAGAPKVLAENKMIQGLEQLQRERFYVCVNEGEWEHHFEMTNYLPLTGISPSEFTSLVREKSFLKIATLVPLQPWEDAGKRLMSNFRLLCGMLDTRS